MLGVPALSKTLRQRKIRQRLLSILLHLNGQATVEAISNETLIPITSSNIIDGVYRVSSFRQSFNNMILSSTTTIIKNNIYTVSIEEYEYIIVQAICPISQ